MHIDTQKESCYQRLAHAVLEAQESCDLPSAGWMPRKAGGVIQSTSGVLTTHSPVVRGQEKVDILNSNLQSSLPIPCLFVLFSPSLDWKMPIYKPQPPLG